MDSFGNCSLLGRMVGPTELESVTSCVSSRRSNQLSYGPRDPQYIMRGLKIRKHGADIGGVPCFRGISLVSRRRPRAGGGFDTKAGLLRTIRHKILLFN